MRRLAGALGFEIPERAVERVARRARRPSPVAGRCGRGRCAISGRIASMRGDDRLDGFAIARIGHAFAAPAMRAVGQFGDHHRGFGLGAAADREGAGDRPAFVADGQRDRGRGHVVGRLAGRAPWSHLASAAGACATSAASEHKRRVEHGTHRSLVRCSRWLVLRARGAATTPVAQAQKPDTSADLHLPGRRPRAAPGRRRQEGGHASPSTPRCRRQESGPLSKAFEQKYGIKVQLWRATSDQVIQRTVNEARAGRQALDVLETNAPEVDAARARGHRRRISYAAQRRPAGLGGPAAPALVRRARQSLGRRLQHHQGEEGGDPADL